MEQKQAQLYYDELRVRFIQADNDWAEKGVFFRTVFENFFHELIETPEEGTSFINWIDQYFDENPDKEKYRELSHEVRKKLNRTVHANVRIRPGKAYHLSISKSDFMEIYTAIVLIIYSCTGVKPDDATLEYLGAKKNDALEGLNDQQKEAILCPAQIVNVNAGPGTGKTKLLVHKLINFIKNENESAHIVALSFTNTAAGELGNRFNQKAFECQAGTKYEFTNGTIHSFCLKTLRKFYFLHKEPFNYIIIGDEDVLELAMEISNRLDGKYTVDEIKGFLATKFSCPQDILDSLEEIKASYKLITINDILKLFIKELDTRPEFAEWVTSQMDILVIDESQDLSKLNFEIFNRLLQSKPDLRLFFVGDPRQNIFEFNGGSYKNLYDFLHGRQSEDVMEKNLAITYRCPKAITDYVNTFEFTDCKNIVLHPDKIDSGNLSVVAAPDQSSEASGIVEKIKASESYEDCAILSPTIKGLAAVIEVLNANKLPYKVFGGRRTLRPHIRAVNNFLKVLVNNNEDSIRKLAKTFNLDVKTQPLGSPRHFSCKELFFRTPFGRKFRSMRDTFHAEEWSLPILVKNIVDTFFTPDMLSDNVKADLNTFLQLVKRYKTPEEYLNAFTLDKSRFDILYDKDFVDCLNPSEENYITLSTIHSAKGLQWKDVFICGMYENNFPAVAKYNFKTEQKRKDYMNSKLKELFVACTRSEENLYISFPKVVDNVEQSPSSFLEGLPIQ